MAYEFFTDEELTGLLQSGNKAAFTEIYNRYWKKLFAVACNKVQEPEEAEEIVQDIFISLWNRREELAISGSLGAYLAVAVKYRVFKLLAKRHREQQYAEYSMRVVTGEDNSMVQWLEFEELRIRLESIVSALPEKCRIVYELRHTEGLSSRNIAEKLNLSIKTVEAHIGKAMKTLRAGLQSLMMLLLIFWS